LIVVIANIREISLSLYELKGIFNVDRIQKDRFNLDGREASM